MVSDRGGRFIPAYIVGVKHIIFTTSVPGKHMTVPQKITTQTGKERNGHERTLYQTLLVGTVHKPRQGGINSAPL